MYHADIIDLSSSALEQLMGQEIGMLLILNVLCLVLKCMDGSQTLLFYIYKYIYRHTLLHSKRCTIFQFLKTKPNWPIESRIGDQSHPKKCLNSVNNWENQSKTGKSWEPEANPILPLVRFLRPCFSSLFYWIK